MNKAVLFSLMLALPFPATARAVRCGGDGPNPLTVAPSGASAEILSTQGQPQEMTMWEKRGEIVYRADDGRAHARQWQNGAERLLAPLAGPLVAWRDAGERFLIASLSGTIFDDVTHNVWTTRARHPRFSEGGVIFSATETRQGWELELVNERKVQRLCETTSLPPAWRLAEGQRYPYFDFYESRPTQEGNLLFTYRIDVTTCAIATWQYLNPIAGAIEAVYAFDTAGSIAAKIDHPTMNLLWTTSETGCRFFDIGAGVPLLPNPALPILATQPNGSDLALVDLAEAKSTQVLKSDKAVGKLNQSDVQLTSDRANLFVRTAGDPMVLQLKMK